MLNKEADRQERKERTDLQYEMSTHSSQYWRPCLIKDFAIRTQLCREDRDKKNYFLYRQPRHNKGLIEFVTDDITSSIIFFLKKY